MGDGAIVTKARVVRVSLGLLFLYGVVVVVSLLVGTAKVDVGTGCAGLLCALRQGGFDAVPPETMILFSIRLPRIIFAGIVGASLSIAGVLFQGLLRNPLAEPFILGISGGAAVGAITAIIIGAGCCALGIPLLAFLGAAATVGVVFITGRRNGRLEPNTLLLAGVIINAFFSALIMFFLSISAAADLHSMTFWLMGNLGLVGWGEILTALVFLCCGAAVSCRYGRSLNLIVTGDETALHLGVNVERTKVILFVAGSLMTAVAVAFAGIIGFVGLIIPHMMRLMLGSDHRLLLPASFLFGASFLVIADTVARSILPYTELPVGVVTALCGAPYFLYLLRSRAGVS